MELAWKPKLGLSSRPFACLPGTFLVSQRLINAPLRYGKRGRVLDRGEGGGKEAMDKEIETLIREEEGRAKRKNKVK